MLTDEQLDAQIVAMKRRIAALEKVKADRAVDRFLNKRNPQIGFDEEFFDKCYSTAIDELLPVYG